jgi:hypothetical protein
MNQSQQQIDCPNADARSAGVRVEATRLVGGDALGSTGVLLITSLISILGIVGISRTARAAT